MHRLDKTTRKLQVVLAGAITTNQLDVVVSYYDVPAQTKTDFSEYKGTTQVATTNSTTDVDICAAPLISGTVRNVDTIHVYNKDTVSATVTIKIDDSGIEHIIVKQALLAAQSLHYAHGAGWQVL